MNIGYTAPGILLPRHDLTEYVDQNPEISFLYNADQDIHIQYVTHFVSARYRKAFDFAGCLDDTRLEGMRRDERPYQGLNSPWIQSVQTANFADHLISNSSGFGSITAGEDCERQSP